MNGESGRYGNLLRGYRSTEQSELRANRSSFFAKLIIIAVTLSAFTHPNICMYTVLAAGVLLCILPGTSDKIFIDKSSIIALLFCAYAVTVAFVSGNKFGVARTCVFAAMFIVFYVTRGIATKKFYEQVLNFTVIGGTLATLFSVAEAISHGGIWNNYRCQAFFANPNFFGTAVMLSILVCAYKAVTHAANVQYYYIASLINAVGIYLCGSMSIWCMLFIGILALLLLNHEYRLMAVFLSIALLVLILVILMPQIIPRLNEFSETTENRVRIWKFAVSEIRQAPVFGHGFFSYKYLSGRALAADPAADIFPRTRAHNLILDCMLSHGIIGTVIAVAFLTCFFASVIKCHDGLKANGKSYAISTFVVSIGIVIAFYGMFDTTFVTEQNGILVMLIAAGIGVDERTLRHLDRSKTPRHSRPNQ